MNESTIGKRRLKNGTQIYLEYQDEEHGYNRMVAVTRALNNSDARHSEVPFVRAGRMFLCPFRFNTENEARRAYKDILFGKIELSDLIEYIEHPEYARCIIKNATY